MSIQIILWVMPPLTFGINEVTEENRSRKDLSILSILCIEKVFKDRSTFSSAF